MAARAGAAQALGGRRRAGRPDRGVVGGHRLGGRPGGLEPVRRGAVGGVALAERQGVVDRPAHQRVHERDGVLAREHLAAAHAPRRVGGGVGVEARERRGDLEPPAVAEHRHRPRQGHRLGARAGHAAQDALAERGDRGGAHGLDLDPGVCRERAQQLAQVERVPGARREARLAQRLVGAGHLGADERGHRLRPQRRERDGDPARHGVELVDQLVGQAGLRGPQGRHERDRQVGDPPCEVAKRTSRRRVHPVQVVYRQQERRGQREVGREPVERVQGPEAGLRAAGALVVGLARGAQHAGGGGGSASEGMLVPTS
jgi:hypothetical protein